MKRRIGMQFFLPLAVYALIAGILTGIFLIFLNDDFTHFVMALVALGALLLSVCLSLMGMVLLDLLKKMSRFGFLFQAIAHLIVGATGFLYFFFRFSEPTSWSHVFFFLALFGAGLGLIYCGRSFFLFSTFSAQERFVQQFAQEAPREEIHEKPRPFNPNDVIEVDAVDVRDEEKRD